MAPGRIAGWAAGSRGAQFRYRDAQDDPVNPPETRAGGQQIPVGLDRISVRGLRVFAHHGVRDDERRDGQEFIIDATVGLDTASAAASDELGHTVDYSGLADRLVALAGGPPVWLIETLAERLAAACLSEPSVQEVEITVHKPHAPLSHPFDDVTVTIRRVRG